MSLLTSCVTLLFAGVVSALEQPDACSSDGGCHQGDNLWTSRRHVVCDDLTATDDAVDQTWVPIPERPVLVFSAFAERRVEAGGPAVRVVASGLQAAYNDIGELFCQMWEREGAGPPTVVPAQYVRIYPSTLHPDMWVAHFVMCPTGGAAAFPRAVSVTPTPCTSPPARIRVLHADHMEKTDTHALCLPPIYNRFSDGDIIVEMIELHKLLGASEITVYNQSVSAVVDRVLRYYSNQGDVNVVQWGFPMDKKANVNCQRGALNDCLYRMGARHRYVTVSDLDEVLVPRGRSTTWSELLATIKRPERGAYLFQHAYFRRNDTGERPYLVSQQSLWRTDEVTPPGKIRCKSMYDSDQATSLDLHFPYTLVPGAQEYILDPEEGILHHYRQTPMSSFTADPSRHTYIEDRHMRKFGPQLKERINQIRQELINY